MKMENEINFYSVIFDIYFIIIYNAKHVQRTCRAFNKKTNNKQHLSVNIKG